LILISMRREGESTAFPSFAPAVFFFMGLLCDLVDLMGVFLPIACKQG
jgi:hypothetical protein